MKKTIIMIAALGASFSGIAQDKYVVSANMAMNSKNYDEAKENIDKAMANPETKEKPKALFAKAQIYMQLQSIDKYKASNPYRDATQTAFHLLEVKPDYERNYVDPLLISALYSYYNDGIRANTAKRYDEAAEMMGYVVKIHDLDGGKRFAKSERSKQIDTLSAEAANIMAVVPYYSNKYDEATPLLVNVKNNPITRSANVYQILIDVYSKQKNTAEAFAMIQEGRKYFPNDAGLRAQELNYYITAGKQDELLKKLEEAATQDADNADIQFNLATTYLGMATPKDGKKPANSAELFNKAEAAYTRATAKAPDNAGFNYNFGALYFNQAIEVNDQMNAVGTTAADQKKFDDLKVKRDALFAKSTPYFEKAYTALAAKESDLRGEDKGTYKSTLLALREVYARQSKNDKSAEMKAKYDALPK